MSRKIIESIIRRNTKIEALFESHDSTNIIPHVSATQKSLMSLKWEHLLPEDRDDLWLAITKINSFIQRLLEEQDLPPEIDILQSTSLKHSFSQWLKTYPLIDADVYQRQGIRSYRYQQHAIAKIQLQDALKAYHHHATIALQNNNLSLASSHWTSIAQLITHPALHPVSNHIMYFFEDTLKKAREHQQTDYLCLAYFQQGVLFFSHGLIHYAKSAFERCITCCEELSDNYEQSIDYFCNQFKIETLPLACYQTLVDGLHDYFYIHQVLSRTQLWRMASAFSNSKKPKQAELTKHIAFTRLDHFNRFELTTNEHITLHNAYISWFKTHMLKLGDKERIERAWYPLTHLQVEEKALDQASQVILQSHRAQTTLAKKMPPVTAQHPPANTAPLAPQSLSLESLLPNINQWLSLIEEWIRKRTTRKQVSLDSLSSVETIKSRIDQQLTAFTSNKKTYPDVIPLIDAVLGFLDASEVECTAEQLKLANLYMLQEEWQYAKTLFLIVLKHDDNHPQALLGLANIALKHEELYQAKHLHDRLITSKDMNETHPLCLDIGQKITTLETNLEQRLKKIQTHRLKPQNTIKEIQHALLLCQKWLGTLQPVEPLYPYVLFESVLLKIEQAKKLNNFYNKRNDEYFIDVSFYSSIYGDLEKLYELFPQSEDVLFYTGLMLKLAGNLFKVRYHDESLGACKDNQEQLLTSMHLFYRDSSEFFNKLLKQNPQHHEARWHVATMLENSNQYAEAQPHFEVLSTGDSTFAQPARLKLAELAGLQCQFLAAYEQFNVLIEDLRNHHHPFHQANRALNFCSLTRLTYCAGMAAYRSGLLEKAQTLLITAQEIAQTMTCHDFNGFRLLVVHHPWDRVSFNQLVHEIVREKAKGAPILLQCKDGYYFYNITQNHHISEPARLPDLSKTLFEEGISLAPGTLLLLKGSYHTLFYQIREAINDTSIPVWDKKIKEDIDNLLEKINQDLAKRDAVRQISQSGLSFLGTMNASASTVDESKHLNAIEPPEFISPGL